MWNKIIRRFSHKSEVDFIDLVLQSVLGQLIVRFRGIQVEVTVYME